MFDTVTLDEPISKIRSGIDGLAGEDRSGWTSAALTERLTEAVELRNRLDAEVLRLTAEWDRSRAWEADGALSATSWLTHRLPVSRTRARDDVRAARFLEKHERVAKSVLVGDVSVDHVRVLARVVNDRRQHLSRIIRMRWSMPLRCCQLETSPRWRDVGVNLRTIT